MTRRGKKSEWSVPPEHPRYVCDKCETLSPRSCSKLTNQYGGPDDSSYTTTKAPVQDDGQGLVDNDVTKEQSNQDPVLALVEKLHHPLRILLLRFGGILGYDLQVDAILTHKGNCQAGKGTAKQHEEDGGDVEDP